MTYCIKVAFVIISLTTVIEGFSQKQLNDTIVLKRSVADPIRSKVFIDPDKNSKYYKQLSYFGYDNNYFSEMVKILEDSAGRQGQVNKLPGLPKKWLPLYLYKGKYYVYAPCDGIYIYKIMITDEYVCETEVGGLYPREFNSLKMIDQTSYINSETNYMWNEKDLHINIIDNQKGIAIFSTTRIEDSSIHYRLMVDANKIKLFPVIKNECLGGKEPEFDFEEPDFEKLLDKKDVKK